MKRLCNKLFQYLYWIDVYCKYTGEPKPTPCGGWAYEIEVRTIKYYFMGIRIWTKTIMEENNARV